MAFYLAVRMFIIACSLAACGGTVGPQEVEPLIIHSSDPVIDFDGYQYQTVRIGSQVWMAENLRSERYSDGAPIQGSAYQDDPTLVPIYGRLYDWAAATRGANSSNTFPSGVQGACPVGWHLPSDSEWLELITSLGGVEVAGGKLKEAGTSHWQSPNTGADNESLFSALPAGFKDFSGEYRGVGEVTFFATASAENAWEVYVRELTTGSASIPRGGIHPDDRISVRCVRN